MKRKKRKKVTKMTVRWPEEIEITWMSKKKPTWQLLFCKVSLTSKNRSNAAKKLLQTTRCSTPKKKPNSPHKPKTWKLCGNKSKSKQGTNKWWPANPAEIYRRPYWVSSLSLRIMKSLKRTDSRQGPIWFNSMRSPRLGKKWSIMRGRSRKMNRTWLRKL